MFSNAEVDCETFLRTLNSDLDIAKNAPRTYQSFWILSAIQYIPHCHAFPAYNICTTALSEIITYFSCYFLPWVFKKRPQIQWGRVVVVYQFTVTSQYRYCYLVTIYNEAWRIVNKCKLGCLLIQLSPRGISKNVCFWRRYKHQEVVSVQGDFPAGLRRASAQPSFLLTSQVTSRILLM